MKVILAVMCTTWAVVKIRPEKIQACTGFQPMTSAILVQRSTNWANKPTGSWFFGLKKHEINVKYGPAIKIASQLESCNLLSLLKKKRVKKNY